MIGHSPKTIVVIFIEESVRASPTCLPNHRDRLGASSLKKLVTHTAAQQDVTRASIVLLAARFVSNNKIATRLGISVDTVRKWRGRYAAEGRDGLADRPRSGRPPTFTPVQVAEVKALACQPPAEHDVPLSVWSCPELVREAVTRGIAEVLSPSTVRRWLAEDAIKPWQHQSWIFIRDPDFGVKASRVLDLYARVKAVPWARTST
jgi:transposase